MKRHEATLARRCPLCCAPVGVPCYWPGRKTTHDVPHPSRINPAAEILRPAKRETAWAYSTTAR